MGTLNESRCEACRPDAPKLADDELEAVLLQLPDWKLIDVDGVKQFQREFSFSDFRKALAFLNTVAELAEEEDHHPSMLLEWAKVTVTWWTHKVQGVHRNDAIMAAKTDAAYHS